MMPPFQKYYGGLIFLLFLIALYLFYFIYTLIQSSDADNLSQRIMLFGFYFFGFLTSLTFIFSSLKMLPAFLLLLGTFFLTYYFGDIQNKKGKDVSLSLLTTLVYFFGLIGVILLWKKASDENDSTSTTSPSPLHLLFKADQIKYLGLFIAYAVAMVLLYTLNPAGIMTKFGGASVFLSIFVGFILVGMVFGYSQLDHMDFNQSFWKIPYIIVSIIVSGLLMWWILDAFGVFSNNADQNIWSILFNFAILLGALALLYKFSNIGIIGEWIKQNAFFRSLTNSLLFIACVFSKLMSNPTTNPFAGTKKNDIIALMIVLGIYVLYFIMANWIIPGLKKWYFLKGGNQLVGEPVSIDKLTTLSTFAELNDVPTDTKDAIQPSYNYGISFWLYVDSFAPSTSSAYSKHSTILDYGGVPLVKYYASTNTLGVYIRGEDADHPKSERLLYSQDNMPLQKWNNVVINYLNGTVDIFYNGSLVSSSIKISPPIVYDTMTVGMADGISGNIANVVYYQEPLSLYQINTLYNSLKLTSPPIN